MNELHFSENRGKIRNQEKSYSIHNVFLTLRQVKKPILSKLGSVACHVYIKGCFPPLISFQFPEMG